MTNLSQQVSLALRELSPEALWALQPPLLALDTPEAQTAREVARDFYCYLSAVRSRMTSKQFSALAAGLAATSVGVLGIQNLLQASRDERQSNLQNLLTGGLAETLEVFSTFQHVHAWETEFASLHDEAAWDLYAAYWRLAAELQPDRRAAERQAHVDALLAPARRADLGGAVRAAYIIRLYEVLLAVRLAALAQPEPVE